jgi:hypothetical protein
MNAIQKAEKSLLDVAKKYGASMTELPASEHRPKDVPFRMSIARAYVAYRRAVEKSKRNRTSTTGPRK